MSSFELPTTNSVANFNEENPPSRNISKGFIKKNLFKIFKFQKCKNIVYCSYIYIYILVARIYTVVSVANFNKSHMHFHKILKILHINFQFQNCAPALEINF